MSHPGDYWLLNLRLMRDSEDAFWAMYSAGTIGYAAEDRRRNWEAMHRKLERIVDHER